MRGLVDAAGRLPQPTMAEQLAVSIADRLPGVVVVVLGQRGVLGLAWVVGVPLRVVGAVGRMFVRSPGLSSERRA